MTVRRLDRTLRRSSRQRGLGGTPLFPLLFLLVAPVASGLPLHGSPTFQVTLEATPSQGVVPLLVSFQAGVLSGTPTWFAWSFGDGSNTSGTPAEAANVAHTYVATGDFLVVVTVSEESQTANQSITIHVEPSALVVHASATPAGGVAPLTVLLQGSVSGGTGTYNSFLWELGDGRSASGLVVPATYDKAGDFHVEFTAFDTSGASASTYLWVNVTSQKSTPTTAAPSVNVWEIVLGVVAGFTVGTLVAWLLLRRRRPPAVSPAPVTEGPSGGPLQVAEVPKETTETTPGPSPVESISAIGPKPALAPTPSAVPEPVPASARSSEPAAPVPRAPPSGHEREALRISERVVLHLASQGALHADEVAPVAFTQAGMAEALSIRQNALTNVLRRLEAAGVLTVDVRHVTGRPRRMKVYRLTGRGELLAKELRWHSQGPDPPSS